MQSTNSTDPVERPETSAPESFASPQTPASFQTPPAQPAVPSQPPKKGIKRFVIIALSLLLVLGGVAAVYFLALKQDGKSSKQSATAIHHEKPAETPVKLTQLVFTDTKAKTITVTDSAGETKRTINYAASGRLFAQVLSSSASGDILLELSDYTANSSTYMLVDHNGRELALPANIPALLKSTYNATEASSWPAVFMDSADEALVTSCPEGSNNTYDCKLLSVNLANGQTKTILAAESPTTSVYGTLFRLHGFSSDEKTAYMHVAGPSSLTKDERALITVDLASGKVTQKLTVEPGQTDCSLSPDAKLWVCAEEADDKTTTFVVTELNNPKAVKRVSWPEGQVGGGIADRWVWSPDSTKMAFYGSMYNERNNGPLTLGYLNIKDMKITNLKTFNDSSVETISHLAWLNENQLLYDHNTTTSPNNFIDSVTKVEILDVASKKSTQLAAPGGYVSRFIKVDQ